MKVTNQTVREAFQAVQILGGSKLPVKVSLQVAKLKKELKDLAEPVEETRQTLVKQHAELDKEGKPKQKENGEAIIKDREAFNADFKTLMDETVEVQSAKITLPATVASTCDKCHHNMDKALEIEPNILEALIEFLE